MALKDLFSKAKQVVASAGETLANMDVDAKINDFASTVMGTKQAESEKSDAAAAPAAPVAPEVPKVIEYTVVTDFELEPLENEENVYSISKYIGFGGEEAIEIPSQIDGKRILGIGNRVFYENTELKHLKIAEGIGIVGVEAFCSCTALETIELPESMLILMESCFLETAVKEINLPDNITQMGEAVFGYCKSLERVKLPANLSVVAKKSFAGCERIKHVQFPTVPFELEDEAIPYYYVNVDEFPANCIKAGSDCISLRAAGDVLRIPEAFTSIGEICCEAKKLIIPASVTHIGIRPFEKCSGVEECYIEKGCTAALPVGCFSGCDNLKKLSIPSTVSEISKFALYDLDIVLGCEEVYSGEVRLLKDIRGKFYIPEEVLLDEGDRVETSRIEYGWIMKDLEDLTIYCEPGSKAMDFARENSIKMARADY